MTLTDGPRVAVVDDDTVIRLGISILLHSATVTGAFATVDDLLRSAPPADVVLLDLHLTGTTDHQLQQGAAGVTAVAAADYRILIHTNERRRQVLASCLAAGAHGIIHKAEPIPALEHAIAAVVAGEVTITPALTGLAELIERRGDLPTLTTRQREVLRRRARGETYRSIARHMGIAQKTAEEHMADVARKFSDYLRANSAADLERHLGLGIGDLLG